LSVYQLSVGKLQFNASPNHIYLKLCVKTSNVTKLKFRRPIV